MGRPLSGKTAPKGNRPSLIERFGGKVEEPKPVTKSKPLNAVKPKSAPKKAEPKKEAPKKPTPIKTVDQERSAKRLDTPEAIARRNAMLKAAKEKMNKNKK